MKARLIFPNQNIDMEQPLCADWQTLEKDLGINFILDAMAKDDSQIRSVCQHLIFTPLTDIDILRYRQEALSDAMKNPTVIRELYALCVEAEELRRKSWSWLASSYISGTYSAALSYLSIYLKKLARIKTIADSASKGFVSQAFTTLFDELKAELTDEYLKETYDALEQLTHSGEMLIHARLGSFLQGTDYALCRPEKQKFNLFKQFSPVYRIRPDDHTAQDDLDMRRNRAINELTNALAQAAEHLLAYFNMLRAELCFYVGSLNLLETLKQQKQAVCIPSIFPVECRNRKYEGLIDAGVALTKGSADGNSLAQNDICLYLVTGANQGGKSTFLRSIGQAQLMAQCGMFVCAESAEIPLRAALFSHFKKEEDQSMESGKLDEELARMSRIIDMIRPDSMLLFNESFAATNEREGSEICRQITDALLENGMEIFSVSHLISFVETYLGNPRVCFLQAERLPDGTRTHRILPGNPTKTAYGTDIYDEIFNVR